PRRFALSLAQAHAAGAAVDWGAYFAGSGAQTVKLPTYPFQRERYWLNPAFGSTADPSTAETRGHSLVGASVRLAGGQGEGLLLNGRISLQTHPWLAEHNIAGEALLPAGAFLELALQAGVESGAATVEELALQAPLILPKSGAVALQVTVADPDEGGRREIAIHSCAEEEDGAWTRHATGNLVVQPTAPPGSLDSWPPEGAESLQVDDLYDLLADAGIEYGPLFQGLEAAWKDGEQIYAEVALPVGSAGEAGHFAIHPALLESALQGLGLAGKGPGEIELPCSWRNTTLFAAGASALRLRLAPEGDSYSLDAYEESGTPVLSIGSVTARPLELDELRSARQRGLLYMVQWQPASRADKEAQEQAVVEVTSVEAADDQIRGWLADEDRQGSRLTLLTREAVAAGGTAPDPAAAAVWAVARSAASLHPDRFALIDTDGTDASRGALPAALTLGAEEPQLALREGELLAPRVTRIPVDRIESAAASSWDPDATVLVGGDADGPGGPIARYLEEAHGVTRMLFVEGAELVDRGALEALLGSIPREHPLGAVVHVGGDRDGDAVESLDREALEEAMRPMLESAWNLHELTARLEPSRLLAARSEAGVELFEVADLAQPVLAPVRLSRSAMRAMAETASLPAIMRGLVDSRLKGAADTPAQRLRGLSPDQRETAVLDFVRAQIAEILGHSAPAGVDINRPFIELGVDSVSAMELRKRLDASIGVQIPVSILANQPTARELAVCIAQQLDPTTVTAATGGSTETFVSLLGQALERRQVDDFMGLLTVASNFRASFDDALGAVESPVAARLTEGPDSPSLVLMPSLVAMSGPQEYVRFARGFRGQRSTLVVPLPGFAEAEPLPANVDALARSTAAAILRSGVDSSFVLAGYSSGGWVAHAVAAELEAQGVPPEAIVLLDTPSTSVDTAALLELVPALITNQSEQLVVRPDDARLTAMARYFQLFGEWTPDELDVPVLMVRAGESLPTTDEQIDRLEEAVEPTETIEVPGNHFTMMWDHADTTAQAVQDLIVQFTKSQ
ncbi:MAG TPA: polyketide synthase dehydratase domain-containing protein, partial [Solirubrobacterales bacterium]